ncbi:MAG: hypothetical protein SPJ97_00085 [Bacteroides sp.]|nr:hypothetical protein [Bacteroides sp.]
MANLCTNLFYASSEHKQTIDTIKTFIEHNFPDNWYSREDDDLIEAELASKWVFPTNLFEELGRTLIHDDTLYMRCLSYELYNEYACLSVYREGQWSIGV